MTTDREKQKIGETVKSLIELFGVLAIIGIFIAGVIGVATGFAARSNIEEFKTEAVEHGYAEWVVKGNKLGPTFQWKDEVSEDKKISEDQ